MFSCDYRAKKYADEIQLSANEFDLDPAIIFAVAETESHFNAQAVSPVGAIGVMQIMPKTGQWIASKLSFIDYSDDDLYDLQINIRFGAFYIFYLMGLFSERWMVMAAYNAGENVVRGWLDDGVVSIEMIPYPETKSYVKKVERAICYYHKKKFAIFH